MQDALIVIDMQNDFITGPLGTPEARAILPGVCARVAQYRAAGKPVYFTLDTHWADYLTTQEGQNLPVPHCLRGSEGWQVADGLGADAAHCVEKPVFGAVQLPALVREKGWQSVELVGVCTDICVVSNALLLKSHLPALRVGVNPALCAGVTPQSHAAALQTMAACQVQLLAE